MGSFYCDEVGRYEAFEPTFWLQWHITDRCPGHCRHCYVGEQRRPDPTPAQLDRVLERYQALLAALDRPGRLQISGGEPLVAPHLWDLLAAARRARIPARVLTSGLPVTDTMAARLREAGLRVVQVSIEGDEAEHDAIRGTGSWRRAVRAVERLRDAGLEVTVAATLHAQNPDALTHLRRDLGHLARRIHGARLVPIGEGATLADQMLSPRQWKSVMRHARREAASARPRRSQSPARAASTAPLDTFARPTPGDASPPPARPAPTDAPADLLAKDPTWVGFEVKPRHARDLRLVGGCAAGYAGLTVDVDGTVFPCRRLPIPIGNAYEDDLLALLRDHPLMRRLRDRDQLHGKCGRCDLRWLCGGCRAVAWAVHGDPLAEDPQCPWK